MGDTTRDLPALGAGAASRSRHRTMRGAQGGLSFTEEVERRENRTTVLVIDSYDGIVETKFDVEDVGIRLGSSG